MSPKVQRILIFSLISLGTLAVGFFGLRALFALREFRRHGPPPPLESVFTETVQETDTELIRDWMTVPYISQTYHVHPKVLFDALGISPRGNEEKSLAQLNEEFLPDQPGIAVELVKAAVQASQSLPTPGIPNAPPSPAAP